MNHFSPFLATLVVLTGLVLVSCTQPVPKPEVAVVSKTGIPIDTPPQIDSVVAMSEKNLWLAKRSYLIGLMLKSHPNDPDTAMVAKSFRLQKGDLTGMLNALSDGTTHGTDSLWASLAIRNGQITLIFHDRDLKSGKEVYFDFTRPCPPGTCE